MRKSIFSLAALLVCAALVFGAANGTNSNCATQVRSYPGFVIYSGTFTTAATDCVGTFYTKAMNIGGLSTDNAYSYLVMSNSARGTEDVNVYVEYSFDRSTWTLGSLASGVIKDQLTTTAIIDTINVQTGVHDPYYAIHPYMRIKFVGQTGNPVATTGTWKVKLFKDPTWPASSVFAGVESSL